jgi:glycosyltransferase involved in cell wall biosynthesis
MVGLTFRRPILCNRFFFSGLMRILITAPSLDENRNVSGISTIVRQIVEHDGERFIHFEAGRRDGDRLGPAWFARQMALPLRLAARLFRDRFDAVHINTTMTSLAIWRDAILALTARAARQKVILSIHGGRFLVEEFKGAILKTIAAAMLRSAHAVIVLSEFEKEEMQRRWPSLNASVLPNALAIPIDLPQRSRNSIPRLTFLGRMHGSKGLGEIVKAAKFLREKGVDFEFRAFGNGPMRDEFVTAMHDAIGPRFEYRGVVTGARKWEALAQTDIFVLPSLYGEGLPIAMLEAMAAGCVAVVSDIASVSSVINDNVDGCIIEPGDAGHLAGTIAKLLNDPAWRERISDAAAATVRERYSFDKYMRRLDSIYSDTINKA